MSPVGVATILGSNRLFVSFSPIGATCHVMPSHAAPMGLYPDFSSIFFKGGRPSGAEKSQISPSLSKLHYQVCPGRGGAVAGELSPISSVWRKITSVQYRYFLGQETYQNESVAGREACSSRHGSDSRLSPLKPLKPLSPLKPLKPLSLLKPLLPFCPFPPFPVHDRAAKFGRPTFSPDVWI